MDDLERAAIERSCERLVVAYSHLIDFGQAAKVAELFTQDGVWESADATMRGRAEILAGFGRRQENTGRRSRHVCTNVAIDVASASAATGVCYFTLYRADGVTGPTAAVEGPEMIGEYRDEFVRTDDGWRIAHRQASAAFVRRRRSDAGGAAAGAEQT